MVNFKLNHEKHLNKLLSITLSLLMLLTSVNVYNIKADDNNDDNQIAQVSDYDDGIETASLNKTYSATFTPNFKHSTVAWYAWKSGDDLSELTKEDLNVVQNSGDVVKVDNYNTSNKTGYLVFFVKPEDNCLFTGLSASGNGDYYIVGSGKYGNISWIDSHLVEVAKEAGYIGVFGYSAKGESKSGSFDIVAQSPNMTISAVSNKTNDVVEGEEITFTVTITPSAGDSRKYSVSSVKINSATIGDSEVELSEPTSSDDGKTYTSTVIYKATAKDCENKTISLNVNATVSYSSEASMTSGGTSITTATITKDASAKCNIAQKGQVTYAFESATSGKELPVEVQNLRPSDSDEYFVGRTVLAKSIEITRVDIDNDDEHGYWTFNGWDKESKKMTKDGIAFTGTWKWTEKKGKAGYYLALSSATWDMPEGMYSKNEDGKIKYYYTKKFAKGDTFTVTDEEPTAEGYKFIGWFDKDRTDTKEGSVASIRTKGEGVTYIYNGDTYTLDAMWANMSVESTNVLYDGKEHTIGEVKLAINENTDLNNKYVKQAKKLITEDITSIMYSIDGKKWSFEKPTFKDAGTYTVYVKENIVLNNETIELTGQGEVVIAQRNVTLTSESDSKAYDGTPLTKSEVKVTGDGFVEGEVTSIKAVGTITDKGSVTNTIEIIGSYNSNNYIIKKEEGTLTITAQEIVVGDLKDVVYNGLNQEQVPSVKDEYGKELAKDKDYTISYSKDTKNVGTVAVTVTGINNYSGSVTKTYQITKKDITIKTYGGEKVYDGKELTNDKYEVNGVVDGESIKLITNGGIKNVGEVDNTYTIDWENSNALESNYNVKSSTLGKLKVTKKKVTITSESASKVYDKKALTNFEVNAEGFVEGEGATYDVTGSQTTVGSSENKFTYKLNEKTLASNYDIETKFGQLIVTQADEVVVTIKGARLTKTYDGTTYEVSGYDVSITKGSTYTIDDFKFNGSAYISGKDASTYYMGLKVEQFENLDSNYKVKFVVEDGYLTINRKDLVLTAGSDEKVYDGTALTNNEVEAVGFVEGEGATYVSTGSQIDTGSSDNVITAVNFNNDTNGNNYNVTMEKGTLKVTPVTDKVVVSIKGNVDTVKYDGKNHDVTGYEVTSISNNLYTESNFKFNGDAKANGKNADSYCMGLDSDQFENTSGNFTNVVFEVEDGNLSIEKRNIKLTSATDSKVYDGTALTNINVTVSGDGFIEGEGASYDVTATITNYGEIDNEFSYTLNTNTLDDNYNIEKEYGKLSITKVDEVVVTITGHNLSTKYDGEEKEVSGYDVKVTAGSLYKESDFIFVGDSTIKKTNAGTYYMGLSEDDFLNNNDNFSKVTFVVTDGYLTIDKRNVELISESASKEYDGTPLEKSEVKVAGDGFVDGEANVTATGSIADKGFITNTIEVGGAYNSDNYNIVKHEGTLTVNQAPLTVITYDNVKSYDGAALTAGGKIEGLKNNEIAYVKTTGSRTDFGKSENTYEIVWDSAKASNYKVSVESIGTLTVTKAELVIITDSASKVYDGSSLTAGGKISGLQNNETVNFATTGSQTEVGSSLNSYSLKWDGTAKESNYKISKEELGTLTVSAKNNPSPSKDDDNSPTPTAAPTPTVSPNPVRPTPSNVDPVPTANPSEKDKEDDSTVVINPDKDNDSNDKGNTESETIKDDVTPEVGTKKHWALANLLCAAVSLILCIILMFSKKEKEDDKEDSENLNNDEDNQTMVTHARWRVVALIDVVLSIVLFVLTENITLPMQLVDKWTLLMLALTAINIVALLFGKKFHKQEKKEA